MRNANTYRGARRNAWRDNRKDAPTLTWLGWNDNIYADVGYAIGNTAVKRHITTRPRSKYLPHESVKRGGTGPVFA
jgi:hypothetical protein